MPGNIIYVSAGGDTDTANLRCQGIEMSIADNLGELDPELENVVYRLADEALTNVVKHARADRARVTVSADAFKIFELAYILSVGLVGPALMITALVAVARVHKQLGRLSIVGFAIWVGCVGFAHLWVIAAASASV